MADSGVMKVYQGTPQDVLVEMSRDLTNVLKEAGWMPSGLGVLALINVAATLVFAAQDGQPEMLGGGKAPEFASMLGTLVHGLSGSRWESTAYQALEADVTAIVKSLGGRQLPAGTPITPKKTEQLFMAPISKEVH